MKTTSVRDDAGANNKHPLMIVAEAVGDFFFRPMEPTSLGLMRIATGILVLYFHAVLCIGLTNYLGPDAWVVNHAWSDKPEESGVTEFLRFGNPITLPASDWKDGFWENDNVEIIKGEPLWSIYFHVEDPRWVWAIHLTILFIMLLFTLGLWTRVTSVLTWIGSITYIQRLQGLLFGMDTMSNLALLYLMLAPCGSALSLDRWLQVRRDKRRLGARYLPKPPEPLVSATLVTRIIQINFCLIYFAAGTSKLLGTSWWNGTAPNRFLLNYSFAPFDAWGYLDLIKFLAAHRWMWESVCAVAVIGTLFLELGFPFLVWNQRIRWFMVSGAVLFHTMIALLMGLVTFSLMMLALVLVFVPPDAVRQTVQALGEQCRQLLALLFGRGATARDRSMALSR
jgi:hypothetical protein